MTVVAKNKLPQIILYYIILYYIIPVAAAEADDREFVYIETGGGGRRAAADGGGSTRHDSMPRYWEDDAQWREEDLLANADSQPTPCETIVFTKKNIDFGARDIPGAAGSAESLQNHHFY